MNGVEIISSKTVYCPGYYEGPFWVMLGIIAIIAIGVFIYNLIENDICEAVLSGIAAMFICFFCLIIPTVAIAHHDTDEIDYIEYKVVLSDEVQITEFLEKYEIVEQEGKLFTVREHTNGK